MEKTRKVKEKARRKREKGEMFEIGIASSYYEYFP